MLHKDQEGGLRGKPYQGVSPFYLRLCVCAVSLGGSRYLALPFDPISLVLAQRNGVEPPKKSAFLPRRLHHSRERCCLGGRNSSSPDLGRGLVVDWALKSALRSRRGCWGFESVGEAGGTELLPWRHPKARFFGAPPRFFAQEQRNGVERAVGGRDFYPRKRRTRNRARQAPAPCKSRARNV